MEDVNESDYSELSDFSSDVKEIDKELEELLKKTISKNKSNRGWWRRQ